MMFIVGNIFHRWNLRINWIVFHSFGMSRRSPASVDRQNTDTSGSGKSTLSWQRSEDSIVDQMGKPLLLGKISVHHKVT